MRTGFASLFIVLVSMLMTGCWEQKDVIQIKSDGTTTFESQITIVDDKVDLKTAEDFSDNVLKDLEKVGWKAEKKLVSESKPIKYTFSGKGNIRQVKTLKELYTIEDADDKSLTISFRTPTSNKKRPEKRSIKFDKPLFGGATVLNAEGKKVDAIPEVENGKPYKIVF